MRKSLVMALMAVLVVSGLLAGCQEEKISWVELEPGLSYVDSTVGDGPVVQSDDFVMVHYTGWLTVDGKKSGEPFDSSWQRNEPVGFNLGRGMVIPGWDRGVPGMAVGGKRTLLISPDLAYGEPGRPPVIPPSSTLMFDVEVVSIPTLEVEILEEGTGPVAEAGDKIDVHYTGWLWVDGAKGDQFDSSLTRGRPFSFTLGAGRVIAGWDQGLDGMKVGTKAVLIIPSELGYGSRGSGANIPPHSTLCFEVELMGIQGK